MRKILNIPTDLSTILEIDCYQNLYENILLFLKRDPEKMGCCWPWEFVVQDISSSNQYNILDTELINENDFYTLYGLNKVEKRLAGNYSRDGLLKDILRLIDEDKPVIVSYDQFYSPYHYGHIYQKQHGDHSILIFGYDTEEETLDFISAIPCHVGKLRFSQLDIGFKYLQSPIMIYFEETMGTTTEISSDCLRKYGGEKYHHIFLKYQEAQLEKGTKILKGDICYTPHLLRMLQPLLHMDPSEMQMFLREFLSGTWIWHIGRKAQWMMRTLRDSVTMGDGPAIIDMLEINAKEWTLVTRKLFHLSMKYSLVELKQIENSFGVIEDREQDILQKLCDIYYR